LQARQHSAQKEEADRADQQPADCGSGANPGDQRTRARGDAFQHRFTRARLPLAFRCDLMLKVLHGSRVLRRHGTGLIQPLVADERQDHCAQLR